jgi:hypothetical protein
MELLPLFLADKQWNRWLLSTGKRGVCQINSGGLSERRASGGKRAGFYTNKRAGYVDAHLESTKASDIMGTDIPCFSIP